MTCKAGMHAKEEKMTLILKSVQISIVRAKVFWLLTLLILRSTEEKGSVCPGNDSPVSVSSGIWSGGHCPGAFDRSSWNGSLGDQPFCHICGICNTDSSNCLHYAGSGNSPCGSSFLGSGEDIPEITEKVHGFLL